MQLRYFVSHNEKNMGPFTYAEIESKHSKGELYPTDHVYIADKGDWQPMLEFIMVHAPKSKEIKDHKLDWRRFASGLPAPGWTDEDDQVYPAIPEEAKTVVLRPVNSPIPDFPPPPMPPQAVVQKQILEKTARKSPDKNQSVNPRPTEPPMLLRPSSTPPRGLSKPTAKPPSKPPPTKAPPLRAKRIIDASAVAEIVVLPPRATRLQIKIVGEARVGEELEIVVQALAEGETLDSTFNEHIQLSCNQPLQGLEVMHLQSGQASIKVRCLTQGTHTFSLSLANESAEDQTALHH